VLAGALGLGACAVDRSTELPSFEAGAISLRPEGPARLGQDGRREDDLLVVGGPWVRREIPRVANESVHLAAAADEAEPADAHEAAIARLVQRGQPRAPEARRLPPPLPRAATPRREPGRAPDRSPEVLAREHVLDWPTHVVARQITFYCPASLAAEVHLTGADVHEVHPTRRLARGSARLTCRELTLEAERLTLRLLEDPGADLQVIARGGVRYAGRVRDQVFHEEGLLGLMITNDQIVPLR
jgi:hypothetical protein